MDHLLADAQREIIQKTRGEIERETAFKWAARAVAAYAKSREFQKLGLDNKLLHDAQDYYHEAVEHAAFADQSGQVLRLVREWVHRYVPRDVL